MPAPPQQSCSGTECTYQTPENVPTWELVTQQLLIHQKTAHPDNVQQQGGGGAGAGGQTAKVDKKIRPTINPQMTEENWRFFLDEWARYKRQTGVTGQSQLDELWSCMSEDLRQLAFAEGGSEQLHSETDMLQRIKKLAVVTLHSSVHVVALHELTQQSDENVQTFAARVRGIAASCGLNKTCPGCQQNVSFSDETCYHVVLAGLSDQSMKERALTQAMMETIKDLNSLITWCTADEGGRLGTPGATLNRLTRQSTLRQLRHTLVARDQSGQNMRNKCGYCGGFKHGDGGRAAREKECKAFGKTCNKCQKKGHYSSICKSSPSTPTTEAITEETQDANSNSALTFFAINDVSNIPQYYWRPWQTQSLHPDTSKESLISCSNPEKSLISWSNPKESLISWSNPKESLISWPNPKESLISCSKPHLFPPTNEKIQQSSAAPLYSVCTQNRFAIFQQDEEMYDGVKDSMQNRDTVPDEKIFQGKKKISPYKPSITAALSLPTAATSSQSETVIPNSLSQLAAVIAKM